MSSLVEYAVHQLCQKNIPNFDKLQIQSSKLMVGDLPATAASADPGGYSWAWSRGRRQEQPCKWLKLTRQSHPTNSQWWGIGFLPSPCSCGSSLPHSPSRLASSVASSSVASTSVTWWCHSSLLSAALPDVANQESLEGNYLAFKSRLWTVCHLYMV